MACNVTAKASPHRAPQSLVRERIAGEETGSTFCVLLTDEGCKPYLDTYTWMPPVIRLKVERSTATSQRGWDFHATVRNDFRCKIKPERSVPLCHIESFCRISSDLGRKGNAWRTFPSSYENLFLFERFGSPKKVINMIYRLSVNASEYRSDIVALS